MDLLLQALVNGLTLGCIYAIVALGLTFAFGLLHIVNFAHGQLVALGAYFTYSVLESTGNYFLSAAISLVLVGIVGLAMELGLFRHVRKEPINGLLISIGLIAIFENIIHAAWGPGLLQLEAPIGGSLEVAGATVAQTRVGVVLATLVVLLALASTLKYSRWGKALRASAQNAEAATLMGVDVMRVRALAMIIGASLAALAGTFLGTLFVVEPALGEWPLITGFIVLIVGGAGSPSGAVAAGLGLGIVESVATVYTSTLWATVVPLLLLVAVLAVRPEGLVPASKGRTI